MLIQSLSNHVDEYIQQVFILTINETSWIDVIKVHYQRNIAVSIGALRTLEDMVLLTSKLVTVNNLYQIKRTAVQSFIFIFSGLIG